MALPFTFYKYALVNKCGCDNTYEEFFAIIKFFQLLKF